MIKLASSREELVHVCRQLATYVPKAAADNAAQHLTRTTKQEETCQKTVAQAAQETHHVGWRMWGASSA